MNRDPEIFKLIEAEHQRQLEGMELNTPRDIPDTVITEAARLLTRWKPLQSKE